MLPSIVLGTADIALMEMVTAYGQYLQRRNKIKPYALTAWGYEQGNLDEAKPLYLGTR